MDKHNITSIQLREQTNSSPDMLILQRISIICFWWLMKRNKLRIEKSLSILCDVFFFWQSKISLFEATMMTVSLKRIIEAKETFVI
jgi:hypothetical protein